MTRLTFIALASAVLAAGGAVLSWHADTPTAEGRTIAAPTIAAPTAEVSGETLFQAKGCASCHLGPDTAPPFVTGYPDLRGAAAWAGERRPGLSARAYLAESIRTPGAFRSPAFSSAIGPTTAMPVLGLSDAEVDAVVSYLLAG